MEILSQVMQAALGFWQYMLGWVLGFALLFGILERITPCNRGQHMPLGAFLTDMLYCFIIPLFTRVITAIYTGVGVALLFRGVPDDEILSTIMHGYGPLGQLPVWLQAAIIFIASDIILYWTHRMFHTSRFWPFHAVHHSSSQVSWHSTYRFHPVNTWLSFTLVDSLMLFCGFSLEAVTLMGGVNTVYSAMVHANLNWTFGPFRTIFASPVFHRWHHTAQAEGMDKNFAPTFPLLDIFFGTYYMPDYLPQQYGIDGAPVPEGFFKQLVYPFRRRS
ncbi:MAG: sterol desaturase family protein [Proteobacteria bacterium]|nr:sterol desaturase family protein [Pseudomonadota bacterium]